MTRPLLVFVCLALSGCNCGFQPVSECGNQRCDGGAGGGGGGAGGGAGGGTGGGGTGTNDGGMCRDCLGVEVDWGWVGGNVPFHDSSLLIPCRDYIHQRGGFTVPPVSCEAQVAVCPSTTVQEIDTALADPAVQAALKNHTLFGTDPRPVDGQVFEISSGTGSFDVGSCGAGDCGVKGALKTLVDALHALDAEQLTHEPCKSKFP